MARPSTSEDARKSRVISYRVTPAEHARLAHRAASANMRINEIAKELALSKSDTLKVATFMKYDPLLINELNRIGNNLNQMVKRFHATGRISPVMETLCDRIDQLIDAAQQGEDL